MKPSIPEGKSGDWNVERFTVTEQESRFDAMRSCFSYGGRWRYTPPGTYTRLLRGHTLVMSDTPDELGDLWPIVSHAKSGLVLITGLGLGCAVRMVLENHPEAHVTVVEISHDVIRLVGEHITKSFPGRVTIVCDDAFRWRPPNGIVYKSVWHDIWDDLCGDNVAEMTKLKRRYGRYANWQGCWCEQEMRRLNRQYA